MKTMKIISALALSIVLLASCEKEPEPAKKPDRPMAPQAPFDYREWVGEYLITKNVVGEGNMTLHPNDTLVASIANETDSTMNFFYDGAVYLNKDVTYHIDGTFDYYGSIYNGQACDIVTGYFYAQDSVYIKWKRYGSVFWVVDEFYGCKIKSSDDNPVKQSTSTTH